MAQLHIDGIGKVEIDDGFHALPPEQQHKEVEHIALQHYLSPRDAGKGEVDPIIAPPRNPARMPAAVEGIAKDMVVTPLTDAYAAMRGRMTPDEAQNFTLTAAMGLISPMARGVKPVTQGIRAYHGSPHDFERFDISKIGTGEGAQAYGHGLYFAEHPDVAREYRTRLTGRQARTMFSDENPTHVASRNLAYGFEDDFVRDILKEKFGGTPAQLNEWMAGAKKVAQPGKMYEVNINAKPEQFLDWDKPLAKQPATIVDPLVDLARQHNLMDPRERGSMASVLYDLGHEMTTGSPANASAALREAGIPGIKYLDQGSRFPVSQINRTRDGQWFVGEGANAQFFPTHEAAKKFVEKQSTSNYVLFDDKLVDILRKYGIGGLTIGGAATADHVRKQMGNDNGWPAL